jgi:mono/diheme cytochrome c family protein
VGGIIGPDLTEQGEKTRHDYDFQNIASEQTVSNWLKEHFRDPEMVSPGSEMLKIDLPEDELDALTTFVLGLAKPDIDFEYFTLEALNEFKGNRAALSSSLAFSMACSGCHGKEGAGKDYEAYKTGVPGILNEDVGRVVSEDYIRFTLLRGRSQRQMASWQEEISGLRPGELDALTAMIKWGLSPAGQNESYTAGQGSVAKSRGNPNLEIFSPANLRSADPAQGKQQFDRYCATCHGAAGKGDLAIAINQADFLSNANNEFLFNTLITGRGNATMPAWTNLPETAIYDLVRYMRSWYPYGPKQRSFNASSGDTEAGKLKYLFLCSRCHGEAGQGQTGPSLINRDLLRVADDTYLFNTIAYGRDHSAMFGWSTDVYNAERLSPEDIANIITYMRNKAEEQPAYIYSGANPGDRLAGKESYNAHCAECHGFDGEGPKAPALNNQEFLNAASNGYIAATITVGRKGTSMPEWGYPNEERYALTAKERHDIVACIRDWQRIAIGF